MLQTSAEFEACMPFILTEEGGFSNTSGDHGGATNHGITQNEFYIWLHANKLPLESVRAITSAQYRMIYWQNYWQPHCPQVPAGLNLSLFNINVNGGTGRGVRIIQQALGLHVDALWGPATSAAVAAIVDVAKIIRAFHDDERQFYAAIIAHNPSQEKFASDWFGRNDRCEKASLAMAQKGPQV